MKEFKFKLCRYINIYFFFILTTSPFSNVLAEELPILNWYPTCEYQVLDTVKDSFFIKKRNNEYEKEKRQSGIALIMAQFKQKAKEINADAIIVTKKTIRFEEQGNPRLQGNTHRFTFTADLIKNCHESGTPTEMTPYNEKGFNNIHTGTIELKTAPIVFRSNTDWSVAHTPPTSPIISLEQGIFNMPIGATLAQISQQWGAPSIAATLDQSLSTVGYGKWYWLTFENDRLIQAEYGSPWFTRNFLNYVASSDTFDLFRFQVTPEAGKGDSLQKIQSQLPLQATNESSIWTLKSQDATLHLQFGQYQQIDLSASVAQLDSFKLVSKRAQLPDTFSAPSSWTANDLMDKDNEQLENMATAVFASENKRKVLLMDNHTLLYLSPIGFKRIVYVERAFKEEVVKSQGWRFNKHIFQGQNEANILAQFPHANVYDDEISIQHNDLDIRLYTTKQDDQRVIYEAEIRGNFSH